MEIYKRHNQNNAEWFKVDEKDVIEYCERNGFWKKGSAMKVLRENERIWTPYSEWKIENNK
tara:strand:+ start:100 stop:282 length:183 start_codon:yes stop_codon:yes gene_type:complete